MTYGLGYVVMCKISPHYKETMSPPLEKAEVINNNVQVSDIPHVNTHESNKVSWSSLKDIENNYGTQQICFIIIKIFNL